MTTITLPYPPSANNLWRSDRGTRPHKSDEYKQWLAAAGWLVREQRPKAVPGSYHLLIIADRPDRRARDIDNLIKPISDLLRATQVITDDSKALSVSAAWSDATPAKPGAIRVCVQGVA